MCRGTSRPRATIAEAKDIGEALLSKKPAVLRNVVKPFAEDLSRGPADDATRVVAMAYDRARNAAQQIYSAPMTYGDFLAWSAKPELLDEATLPYGNTTALYLLVTDRHRFQPEASGTLADPNGAAMRDGPLPRLLEEADRASRAVLAGALGESGFDLAWTSLRLGSAYAYPTHVDCYENVIFQLRGRKNVTVYPPATVWDLQPDINHKHWPTGSPQGRAPPATRSPSNYSGRRPTCAHVGPTRCKVGRVDVEQVCALRRARLHKPGERRVVGVRDEGGGFAG